MLKKGQITIFIILGLIIFSIFAMLLYIRSAAVENVLDTQVQLDSLSEQEIAVAIDIIEEEVMNQYLGGAEQFANSGGAAQTGSDVGITRTGLFLTSENNYDDSFQTSNVQVYGTPNPREFANVNDYVKFLESHIQNNLPTVLDPLTERGFDNTATIASVSVNHNARDVAIRVEGDWTLEKAGKTTVLDAINVIVPHNVRGFFDFVHEINRQDSASVDFDPEVVVQDPYTVDVSRGVARDVITITDTSFTIDNELFVFEYERANRPPDARAISIEDDFIIFNVAGERAVTCPATFVDPDEDTIIRYAISEPGSTGVAIATDVTQLCAMKLTQSNFGYTLAKEDVCNLNAVDDREAGPQPGPTIHLQDEEGMRDSYTHEDNRIRCDPTDPIHGLCCDTSNPVRGSCYAEEGRPCLLHTCHCDIDINRVCSNMGVCLPVEAADCDAVCT